MSDPFGIAKAFAVTPQGVITRARPAARKATRPALHPTRGLPGGQVDRRTMDALSGGSVDETVRRIGRATRSQPDEFASLVNPLSGRVEAMTRGNEVGTTPLKMSRSKRRLLQLAEESNNPVVQERALQAASGRYGREGMTGPKRVLVHNHPDGGRLGRRMPSATDLKSVTQMEAGAMPPHEWQVLSRLDQRRFAVSPGGVAEQAGTVPRTQVTRIRTGPGQTPARQDRMANRAVGLDAGSSINGMKRRPKANPLVNRAMGAPTKYRDDIQFSRKTLRAAIEGGMLPGAGVPEQAAAQMGRGLAAGRRARGTYDDKVTPIIRAGGMRVDSRVMKSGDPFEVHKSVQFKDGQLYYYPKKREKDPAGKTATAAATLGGAYAGQAAAHDLAARTAGSSRKKQMATTDRIFAMKDRADAAGRAGGVDEAIDGYKRMRRVFTHPAMRRGRYASAVGAVAGGVAGYKGSKKAREKVRRLRKAAA